MSNRREFIRTTGMAGLGLATLGYSAGKQITKEDMNNSRSGYWNVFDAHCEIGRHLKLQANGLHTSEDLISEMDHYAITEALVVDSLSRENHPWDGNKRILKVTENHSRLHRAWSASPFWIKETKQSPKDFLGEMQRQDIRALFLYPNQYYFKLSDWIIDDILEPLADQKVPVFINSSGSDASDWDAVVALCKRWPTLPVIISENRIRRSQRMFYKALDTCPNLHLELSAYWLHRGIEYITEQWGAHRLLFGSGWPKYGQHMTLANLTTAQINNADKKLIAGDNLRKLISWNKPVKNVSRKFPEPDDEYVEYGRSGIRPENMTFYDVHGHLGEYNVWYHVPKSSIKDVISDLDYYGVKKNCVFSYAGLYSDEVYGNDIVADAVKSYPDHFIGFTTLNLHRGEEEILHELKRGYSLGMRGIKLYPGYQDYPADGEMIDVVCQWAHIHKQMIICHSWPSDEMKMERLVSTYSNACFITAHTTTAYADIMKKYSNLYVCSVPLLSPRACEDVIAAIGADRLIFGSDLLDLPIGWGLGPILFARISPKEKKLILKENLKNLLSHYSLPTQ